ncbi:MAG: hypothetical protein NC331_11485 [Lachnospiraceae bacterium]|nr:hypothetical protein [Lachnospiraceae bacterium]MCM1239990.1 hypothetical protein [Lachnospiraceae bacterium]
MYKEYLKNRKSGMSKPDAKMFGSSHAIHEDLLPKWSFEDVDETCRELSRSELLHCDWGDNIACRVTLSDTGIIYMENRFKNGLEEITDFISKLILT